MRSLLTILALAFAGVALADGPVSIGALAGGGSVVSDSDTGNGQAWGRTGGRTIAYHVGDPSNFGSLTFGIVNGTSPSAAFDGAVTNSTGEVMSYSAGQSQLASGIATFVGNATLQLNNQTVPNVPTRFTITVKRADNTPIALQFDSGGVSPGANVLSTGDFKVNLFFEMQNLSAWGGDNTFRPILDLYDVLATPPGQPPASNTGPVMTGVNTGFYFTDAVVGLTLDEHDAHIAGLIGPIATKVGFIRDDWQGRWDGVGTGFDEVKGLIGNLTPSVQQLGSLVPAVQQIAQQVSQLVGQSGGNPNAVTKSDIDGIRDTLLTLWGLNPCPLPPAQCSAVKFIQNLSSQGSVDAIKVDTSSILIGLNQANNTLGSLALQSTLSALDGKLNALSAKVDIVQDALDAGTSSPSLQLQALQVDPPSSKTQRWIVKITQDGGLVGGSLTKISSLRTGRRPTAVANVLANAVITQLAPGLLDVVLNNVKDVSDADAYLFEASFTISGNTILGNVLVQPDRH
jgi:hypothetical protein